MRKHKVVRNPRPLGLGRFKHLRIEKMQAEKDLAAHRKEYGQCLSDCTENAQLSTRIFVLDEVIQHVEKIKE